MKCVTKTSNKQTDEYFSSSIDHHSIQGVLLLESLQSRGVRYAKSFSMRYFIDIDILQNSLIDIDIDIFENVLIDIDINIFRTGHIDIDIDIDIFKNGHIDIDIDIDIFQIVPIDIDIDIDIFQIFLSIYFRYRYSQNKCRYFIDISKKADISTIDIDISSKKHEKTLISAEKNGFFTQNVLIDIDIFQNALIDIDIPVVLSQPLKNTHSL